MKRISILIFVAIVVISAIGCSSNVVSQPATTESGEALSIGERLYLADSSSEYAKNNPDTGGVDYLQYTYPLDREFLFIESRLVDFIGEEKYNEWTEGEYKEGRLSQVNVLSFLEHFNISKDDFLEKICYMYPEIPLYDPKSHEIADVLYSGDIEKVLKYTKARGAVYSNGKLYSAQWMNTHTAEDYLNEGISLDEINASKAELEWAIWGFGEKDGNQFAEAYDAYVALAAK